MDIQCKNVNFNIRNKNVEGEVKMWSFVHI